MKALILVIAIALAVAAAGLGAAKAPASGKAQSAKTVKVVLDDFTLIPSVKRVAAGKVTFVVRNDGNIPHEFVIIRTTRFPASLPTEGSTVNMRNLAEVENIESGQTRRLAVTLSAGRYVFICNLPGHYKAGQYAGFRVVRV